MRKFFDTTDYVKTFGEELVYAFEKAGKTTNPHAVGEGREKSAIQRMKDILPDGVGIGSGFIIDSNGNVSSQCDIILYEKNLCLKFNSYDEKNSYYNCESVIAVGEVKSDLTKDELKDTIKKFNKIKNLKRKIYNENVFRSYLSPNGVYGTIEQRINQFENSTDQIFTFLICKSFKMTTQNIIDTIKTETNNKYEYINCLMSLENIFISYLYSNISITATFGALEANNFAVYKDCLAFGKLLTLLLSFINIGRTVEYNPQSYIKSELELPNELYPLN